MTPLSPWYPAKYTKERERKRSGKGRKREVERKWEELIRSSSVGAIKGECLVRSQAEALDGQGSKSSILDITKQEGPFRS